MSEKCCGKCAMKCDEKAKALQGMKSVRLSTATLIAMFCQYTGIEDVIIDDAMKDGEIA